MRTRPESTRSRGRARRGGARCKPLRTTIAPIAIAETASIRVQPVSGDDHCSEDQSERRESVCPSMQLDRSEIQALRACRVRIRAIATLPANRTKAIENSHPGAMCPIGWRSSRIGLDQDRNADDEQDRAVHPNRDPFESRCAKRRPVRRLARAEAAKSAIEICTRRCTCAAVSASIAKAVGLHRSERFRRDHDQLAHECDPAAADTVARSV